MFDPPDVKELCGACPDRLECVEKGEEHRLILVGKQKFCTVAKPITFIATSPNLQDKITVPGCVVITSPDTVLLARKLTQADLDLLHQGGIERYFKVVFPDFSMPKTVAEVQAEGTGVQHVLGMLVMIINAICEGKQIHFVHPEAHLHPSSQANLADLFILLTGKQEEPPHVHTK